jgi:uncharacterized protein YceH (UPF0502 family)
MFANYRMEVERADPGEARVRDRRERFVALAEARTDKALKAIRLLGNLSNKSNYEYADSDVAQIVKALESEVRTLKVKFADASAGRETSFKLQK